MKWFLFFMPVMFLFCCKSKDKPKDPGIVKLKPVNYNDTVNMPWPGDSDFDSGYFKGTIPEKLDSIESYDANHLSVFLNSIISKKEIALMNKETLGHSVLVDQRKEVRFDTLKNGNTTIISIYSFGKVESQRITINGFIIRDYKWNNIDSLQEEVFDLEENSFRHFSFKGKEYYYIQAHSFYSFGGSARNVFYHLIYNLENRELSIFQTCRFNNMLFGDANGDENLDYLDFNNADFCTGVPLSDSVTIQLYSCNKKGDFILQKDVNNKPYFIDGNTGDGFTQDSFIVKRMNWPFTNGN